MNLSATLLTTTACPTPLRLTVNIHKHQGQIVVVMIIIVIIIMVVVIVYPLVKWCHRPIWFTVVSSPCVQRDWKLHVSNFTHRWVLRILPTPSPTTSTHSRWNGSVNTPEEVKSYFLFICAWGKWERVLSRGHSYEARLSFCSGVTWGTKTRVLYLKLQLVSKLKMFYPWSCSYKVEQRCHTVKKNNKKKKKKKKLCPRGLNTAL